jgi:hypothetical protein
VKSVSCGAVRQAAWRDFGIELGATKNVRTAFLVPKKIAAW